MNRLPRFFSKKRLALAGSALVLTLVLAALGLLSLIHISEPTSP